MEEVINIGPSNPEPISLDLKKQDETPTVNFGSGIELLMNDKSRDTKKSSSNIEIEDITKLEDELNNLSNDSINIDTNSNTRINLFNCIFFHMFLSF